MPNQPSGRPLCRLCLLAAWLFVLGTIDSLNPFPARGSELRHTAIVKAVENARPSVVNIHGHKTVPAAQDWEGYGDKGRQVNGMGTGIVIDPRGYILTNNHVVEGVSRIQVSLADGRTFIARRVAHELETDLAVIRISLQKELPVISIGTSNDLMIGEPVVAFGNAFGYENTVTRGIISALHRDVPISDTQKYNNLIQTDASINPGNSGGPLLNIDGEVIGINVAVRVGAQGIGFAIPIDDAIQVAARLLSVRRIDKQWHGVQGRTEISKHEQQFIVQAVQKESPALKAELKPGDVITEVDGKKIRRALDFERALLGQALGAEIPIKVKRNQQSLILSLVMAAAPKQRPRSPDRVWKSLGLRLKQVPPAQFQQLNAPYYHGGLEVVAVRRGSAAARQGIRSGDVLVAMGWDRQHNWETISKPNISYILNHRDLQPNQRIKFYLLRDGETLYTHFPVSATTQRQTSAALGN